MTDLPAPPATPRRIAYLGTPDFAVPPLRALVAAGHPVALVVSAPDARRGRRGHDVASPVKAAAEELGIPVTDDPAGVHDAGVDLGVVVAYGALLRPPLLARVPFVNLHFSLLPRWRGAAPVERAILSGDEQTGVCLMAVEEGLDTGGVYARRRVDVDDKELGELRAELVAVGTELLLAALAEGFGDPEPQAGESTYAAKIAPEERHLDWHRPARELARVVRVGGAWTGFRGDRLKVLRAGVGPEVAGEPGVLAGAAVSTGDGGSLELVEVQPAGRGAMAAGDWLRGARPVPGERLG